MNNRLLEFYVNGILNIKMDMIFKLLGNLMMLLRGNYVLLKCYCVKSNFYYLFF